jgi:hypothetical protein
MNTKDRNQAFLKFLALFLVTVTIVIMAVYFDYRLPVRENKVLQEEVSLQRQQDADQQKFVAKMQEAQALLDSLDKPGVNAEQIGIQFSGKINDLSVLQSKDNTVYGLMNKTIIYRLSDLLQAKKNQAILAEKAQHADEAQNQVNQLQQQIATLNQTLATYQHK